MTATIQATMIEEDQKYYQDADDIDDIDGNSDRWSCLV